ncbi:S-layer homology domain-containing protein [Candidatus Peregrinibacteria bacterium]|nr:MAG: S-layer homology domain-containing protein [Candidatus Peregrinibacteria bacterium]
MKKIGAFLLVLALLLTSLPFLASADATHPDLTVSNMQFTENTSVPGYYTVTVDYANLGGVSVDPNTAGGYNIATLNGSDRTTVYAWNRINVSLLDFLNAGDETTGVLAFSSAVELVEGDEIEVCIDGGDVSEESDEDNNCVTEIFSTSEEEPEEEEEPTPFILEAGSDQTLTLGEELTLQAYIQDLAGSDAPFVRIDWGDGSGSENPEFELGDTIYITATHLYAAVTGDEAYTVEICVEDVDQGASIQHACDSFEVTVLVADADDDEDEDEDDDDENDEDDSDDDDEGGSPYYGGSSGSGGGRSSTNIPDLSVEDIYLQADGDIIAVLENKGDKDVSSNDEVRVELSIDGDVEWSRDYEQNSSDTFLDEGEDSEVNMGDLLRREDETYELEVCVDTEDEVREARESNNCRTEYLNLEDDAGDEDDDDDEVRLSSVDRDDRYDDERYDGSCDDGYFYDIDRHWAEEEICDLYDREVVQGRKRHYYIPNDSVTRAEFLKIALLNSELDVEIVRSADEYLDVDSNDWFYDYVTFATDLGIVNGSKGRFFPNQAITRAEAMVILVRLELEGDDLDDLLDEDLDDSDIDFDDVDDRDWFAPYIVYGDEEDLIEGYDNDTFRPANSITRAEAAEIADKLFDHRY